MEIYQQSIINQEIIFSPRVQESEPQQLLEKNHFFSNINDIRKIKKSDLEDSKIYNPIRISIDEQKTQQNINKIKEKLPLIWKNSGFRILMYIQKMIQQLQFHSPSYRLRTMSQKQFKLIGDPCANYKYLIKGGFLDNKTAKNRIRNFFQSIQPLFQFIIIRPENSVKLFWDFIIMLIIFQILIYIPIGISFKINDALDLSTYHRYIQILVNEVSVIIFLIDIISGFITAFYYQGILVRKHKKIAQNYLKTFFLGDMIAILPYILCYFYSNPYINIIFLLRIPKLIRILKNLEENFSLEDQQLALYDISKLIITIVFVAHYCACMFFLISQMQKSQGNPSWIDKLHNYNKNDIFSNYIISLYWAVITMITVGYGDIVPINNTQRIVVIFITLLSCGMFAYAVNQIGSIFEAVRQRDQIFRKKINSINSYFRKRNLNHELLMKVQRYCEYLHQQKSENQQEIEQFVYKQLHSSLKSEVLTDIYYRELQSCQVFSLNFSERILQQLAPLLAEQTFGPEEIILSPGALNNRLWIIVSGSISLYLPNKQDKKEEYQEIQPQNLLGIRSFFTGEQEQTGAVCQQVVRVLFLEYDSFIQILKQQRQDYERFCFMRDEMKLYGQSSGLQIYCQACMSYTHSSKECSIIHQNIAKDKFIKKSFFKIENRRKFERRYQNKYQAIKESKLNATLVVQRLVTDGLEFQNFEEDEVFYWMKKIEKHNNLAGISDFNQIETSKTQINQDIQEQEAISQNVMDSGEFIGINANTINHSSIRVGQQNQQDKLDRMHPFYQNSLLKTHNRLNQILHAQGYNKKQNREPQSQQLLPTNTSQINQFLVDQKKQFNNFRKTLIQKKMGDYVVQSNEIKSPELRIQSKEKLFSIQFSEQESKSRQGDDFYLSPQKDKNTPTYTSINQSNSDMSSQSNQQKTINNLYLKQQTLTTDDQKNVNVCFQIDKQQDTKQYYPKYNYSYIIDIIESQKLLINKNNNESNGGNFDSPFRIVAQQMKLELIQQKLRLQFSNHSGDFRRKTQSLKEDQQYDLQKFNLNQISGVIKMPPLNIE